MVDANINKRRGLIVHSQREIVEEGDQSQKINLVVSVEEVVCSSIELKLNEFNTKEQNSGHKA